MNAVQMACARVFVRVGEAGSSPPAQSMIADLFPARDRGCALGLFASGANLGVILAYGAAGLISAAYGWRTAFIVLGLPGLLLAAVLLLVVKERARPRRRAGGRQ